MLRFREILSSDEFRWPLFIALAIVFSWAIDRRELLLVSIGIGIFLLLQSSFERVKKKKWNLDYVAFLALATAIVFGEWLTGAILAFMVAVSAGLETFGTRRAEKTIRGLFDRFPKEVTIKTGSGTHTKALSLVESGEVFYVRTNEMIPLDSELVSDRAVLNEANLTGEMAPVTYRVGQRVRSGCVNTGEMIEVRAVGDFEHSSYRTILRLVEEGKLRPSPLVRLAERANIWFSLFTIGLSVSAYFITGSPDRFLAVLVIATPCPLLIAAPMSFLGGLNKAARQNIVIKSPIILELLAKTTTVFFDKTGTLTLGEPKLVSIECKENSISENEALTLAASLEWGSLHPLAKTLIRECESRGNTLLPMRHREEKIGEGVRAEYEGKQYRISKGETPTSAQLGAVLYRDDSPIAEFFFDDVLKDDVGKVFSYLSDRGYLLGILTGDKKKNAERLFGRFGLPVYSECTPERKSELVMRKQKDGHLVLMVGDGMNDAPALALADVGIVFSGTENSASIEAADVAILGNEAWRIRDAVHIGRRSYHVARESVLLGIGLSFVGMVLAALGYIPPLSGAVLQEVIDAVVILNALRSTY